MKPTATPLIEVIFDESDRAYLSVEDARALFDQLGEALGVFRPAPVVPIPIETIQPVGIPEREQDEIYQEWRDSLVVEPAQETPEPVSKDDGNALLKAGLGACIVEDAKRLAEATHVDETPEPCACSDDVPATSADLEEWEAKLLEDWQRIRAAKPNISDSAVIARMQGPYTHCRFAELRGMRSELIRQHLRRLGMTVADPLTNRETGRLGAQKQAEARALMSKWRNGLTTEQWVVKLWNQFDDPPSARVSRILQKTTRRRDGIAQTASQIRGILVAAGIEVDPPAKRGPECTWQERLVQLWADARERHPQMSDAGRLARLMATCTRSPHPELKAIGSVVILRTLLRELGQTIADPPSKSECGRLGAPKATSDLPQTVGTAGPTKEPRPIEKCTPPSPLSGHEIEVTMQLIHALTDGGRWRMPDESERVMRELRSACSWDIGSNPGLASGAAKLTIATVTKFDSRHDDWLTAYADLPPYRRKDIDQELMREWRRVAA